MTAATLATLAIATAAPASAADSGFPPKISGSAGGSGTGSGGGGAGAPRHPAKPSQPDPIPAGTTWVTITKSLNGTTTATTINGITITCAPKADGRKASSATLRALYAKGGAVAMTTPIRYTTSCAYSAPPTERTISCPIRVSGDLVGPTGPDVRAGALVSLHPTRTSAWEKGGRKATTCDENLTTALSAVAAEMGWWHLALAYESQTCTVLDYAGSQQDVIKSCSPVTKTTSDTWLTVSCQIPGGFAYAKVAVPQGFGVTSCEGGKSDASWSCAPAQVTYDGLVGPGLSILGDGKHREARWGQTTVDGLRDVRVTGTRYWVDEASTPLRDRGQAALSTQPITLRTSPTGSDLALSGALAGEPSLWVAFYDAGLPGSPSVTHRSILFEASFPVTRTRISGIDLYTGKPIVESYTAWEPGTGGCESEPLSVDVYRARISN